jgi:hypothetical protein
MRIAIRLAICKEYEYLNFKGKYNLYIWKLCLPNYVYFYLLQLMHIKGDRKFTQNGDISNAHVCSCGRACVFFTFIFKQYLCGCCQTESSFSLLYVV